jgi:hypothetical protein
VHRRLLLSRPLLCVVISLLVGATQARADTIRITSGTAQVAGGTFGAVSIDVSGERGFSFVADIDRQSTVGARTCLPCTAGTLIPLDAIWSGLDFFGGVATLDGVTYPRVGSGTGPNELGLRLAGSAPAPTLGSVDHVLVTAPFSLSGIFRFGPSPEGPSQTADLVGSGTATLTLTRGTGDIADAWNFEGIRYDFQAQSVPTPEPRSLLLVASGLALIAGRAWTIRNRRRRAV